MCVSWRLDKNSHINMNLDYHLDDFGFDDLDDIVSLKLFKMTSQNVGTECGNIFAYLYDIISIFILLGQIRPHLWRKVQSVKVKSKMEYISFMYQVKTDKITVEILYCTILMWATKTKIRDVLFIWALSRMKGKWRLATIFYFSIILDTDLWGGDCRYHRPNSVMHFPQDIRSV